jgi:hypothetical protein
MSSYLELLSRKYNTYNFYKDYVGKQFVHLLDYYENGNRRLTENIPTTPDIALASWVSSSNENEDPTFLSFDLYIKWNESPLFNGSVEKFIETYKKLGNTEIGSRDVIISEFKKQFLNFFRVDAQLTAGQVPQFLGQNSPKAYYLKEITGLDNLTQTIGGEKSKQFTTYGTDMIGMKFYEDVTQNLGYLSALYKSLSWSRINGKQIIPENLLRFDAEIVVTDLRKFNRIVRNIKENKLEVYADKLTHYKYSLFECQFIFSKFPHGDSLSTATVKEQVDDFEVSFNYKFSTLSFNKLNIDPQNLAKKIEFAIDNSRYDLSKIKSKDTTNNSTDGGSIKSTPNTYPLVKLYTFDLPSKKRTDEGRKEGALEDAKDSEKSKNKNKKDEVSDENKKNGVAPDQQQAVENANKPDTESDAVRRRRETVARLERISGQARDRSAAAQRNLNDLPQSQLLDRTNAFLNQSTVGQSPTLSRAGNRLLRGGQRRLNTELLRQAALLNRSLSNIRFR